MLALGWWLAPITLYHLLPLDCDSLSWRELFPAANRPWPPHAFFWMRWIRNSVSSLLPVAGVGGDVVGARLAHQRGVSGAQATASMVVDITVGAATQLVFVIAGVMLLAAGSPTGARRRRMGASDRRRRVRRGDRLVRPSNTTACSRVILGWPPTGSRRRLGCPASPAGRNDRRRDRRHISAPPALVHSSLLRLADGRRHGRGLDGDARARQAPEPDRCR